MAYNYGPPPGVYGQRQPSYSSMPHNGPPGFASGMEAPPGIPMSAQSPIGQIPSQFQPPPNMPNFNINAPVIRLGVDGNKPQPSMDRYGSGRDDDRGGRAERGSNAEPIGRRDRLGLGADERAGNRNLERDRQAVRDSMQALQPPTREEVARTIFVGGLGEGAPGDEAVSNILRTAGKLRRWTRCYDAKGARCKFGFAEFEDVESLEAANEIFGDVSGIEVPLFKDGAAVKDDDGESKTVRLNVVVDPQSKEYIEEWKGKRKEDDEVRQFRIDGCKEDLRALLVSIGNTGAFNANSMNGSFPAANPNKSDDDSHQTKENDAEILTINVSLDDELADIPADQRAVVADEIKSFRDRSTRRDHERNEREKALGANDRPTSSGGIHSRLSSLPPSGAPSGPAGGANGIPVAPRGNVLNAPSGPRGYRGNHTSKDWVNGGFATDGTYGLPKGPFSHEEEEDSASDEEIERRRKARRDEDIDKSYKDAERRLLNRERTRRQALDREKSREEEEKRLQQRAREQMGRSMREWDDYEEEKRKRDDYYIDRNLWARRRAGIREREAKLDEQDRVAEKRETDALARDKDIARSKADDLLNSVGNDMARSGQPTQGFKLSLGSAAAKSRAQAEERRGAAAGKKGFQSVENLLEDEEDAAMYGVNRRPELKPLDESTELTNFKDQDLTEEERNEQRTKLASEVPTSQADLFQYKVKWQFLTPAVMESHIRSSVVKKVVEYLGVQDDFLVESVLDAIKKEKSAVEVVELLRDIFEDEAEVMVKKIWRLVVFWSESEARGLGL